jgi:RNA recognition motif-containing protein
MSTKLHVGNIPSTVLEDDLQAIFAKFGPVDTVEIARDSGTGLSRGFAIVAMAREQDAVTAIGRMNFTQYTIGVSRSR